jgi:hypothetical protein
MPAPVFDPKKINKKIYKGVVQYQQPIGPPAPTWPRQPGQNVLNLVRYIPAGTPAINTYVGGVYTPGQQSEAYYISPADQAALNQVMRANTVTPRSPISMPIRYGLLPAGIGTTAVAGRSAPAPSYGSWNTPPPGQFAAGVPQTYGQGQRAGFNTGISYVDWYRAVGGDWGGLNKSTLPFHSAWLGPQNDHNQNLSGGGGSTVTETQRGNINTSLYWRYY